MKNKSFVFIMVLICLSMLFTACGTSKKTYSVTFDVNGGVGSVATLDEQASGATITIPETSVSKEGFDFLGWRYGDKLYVAGDTFTMPKENVTLVAAWEAVIPTYSVLFDLNDGVGDAPVVANQKEGATFTIPTASITKEFYTFGGWRYNSNVYNEGDTFTMPAEAVTLTAIWNQLDPTFSQTSYAYDRLGAGPLELPLNLQGSNLYVVEINDEAVANMYFSYDDEKKCLVIQENYVLSLAIGDYTVKAITDGDGEPALCQLTIDNSVKTSFDQQTVKNVDVAKNAGVTFSINYNGTTIVSLKQGDKVIDSSYYEVGEDTLTIKSDLLKKYTGTIDFSITLSNHDSYDFSVRNNVLFYTDYDFTTIHNELISAIGHNPLYQYATAESIKIVDGPECMSGKVLKFVPSEEGNIYQVYGLYTFRRSSWQSTWYQVDYSNDKYYVISFDYMTENTTDGDFYFGESSNSRLNYELLIGEENDGVLHHFECVVKGSDINQGTFVYAKDIGGTFYFDNFSVIEVENVPSISVESDCTVGYDYTVSFDAKGWDYVVTLDGEVITATVDANAKTLTISAATLEELSGKHILGIKTAAITITAEFNIVDNRVANLRDASVNYSYEKHQAVKVYGSFDSTLEIVSLKQKAKEYDNGYSGGWSFAHNNIDKNYKDFAALTAGMDNTGYITLSTELLDMLWGTTEFELEFSNGIIRSFNVVVTDVLMYSDYDNTTIKGWLGGDKNRDNTPLSSGFGGVASIADDGSGNNMLYVNSVVGEPNYYNIKFCTHQWEWYNAFGDASHYYRVTFDYQISGLAANSVYFEIFSLATEDKETNFFGNYDAAVLTGDFHRVTFYLNTDGQKHTFDSGWFTYNDSLRLMRLVMPAFAAAEGKYVALDNFRLASTPADETSLSAPTTYVKGTSNDFSFSIGAQVVSAKLDDNVVSYAKNDDDYTISADVLEALSFGSHKLVVYTEKACYKVTFSVVDSRISQLTETNKNVTYGGGDVKLAGNFATDLNVVSVTRKGSDTVWDASVANPVAVNNTYISVAADGLVVSEQLINKLYATTVIKVTFDNGNSVEFTLVSNIKYFSDYDETNVFVDITGNSVICQDRNMIEVVDVNGDHKLKYTPANAMLGHSVSALNNTRDNFCFTVDNRNNASYNWYDWYPTKGGKLIIFFDYEVVLGDNEEASHYQFEWQDINGTWHTTKLTGSGHFSIELDESQVAHFGINCPASSKEAVDGTYILIDSIGFGEVEAEN